MIRCHEIDRTIVRVMWRRAALGMGVSGMAAGGLFLVRGKAEAQRGPLPVSISLAQQLTSSVM